ncbi:HTH_Tnp_Tc3_2 domain-containing protein [Trichonephila clavipes]|nr:HTH_Tnp_Tc3_2 domain-containing protein [Trichonephila clavipes]
MNCGSFSASELRTQQMSIRSDSQSNGQNFCCIEIQDTFQGLKKKPHHRVRAHYEQLSEFERSRIIRLKDTGWANWRFSRHMGRNDAPIRRCWQEWVDSGRFLRHDGRGRPKAAAYRKDRLIVRLAVAAPYLSLRTLRRVTRIRVSTMTIHRRLMERN